LLKKRIRLPKQQSHHCGIETIGGGSGKVWHPSSNRTIVGLKQQQAWLSGRKRLRSNRTIVGLKRAAFAKTPSLDDEQQSHHCGIETDALEIAALFALLAAIAPLWD